MREKYIILVLILALFQLGSAQVTKKVLFIGNSYTAVNNLPVMVNEMATSTGKILEYDSNTPGGFRFINHATNATTLAKITSNNWDYVVLQAQSQEAALSQIQMQSEVFPYATTLSDLIRQNNSCSQPLFYMTWGRQYGDLGNCPYLPWVCTYEGMDDVIRDSYEFMADENNAELAPVGAVWRYLRANNSNINLYSNDESHPSIEGSYAAACALYTMIYKTDPTLISWNSTLTTSIAASIKQAAKTIVFDQMSLWDFTVNPADANFTEDIQGGVVSFNNTSADFDALLWDFGDGITSIENNPTHIYANTGFYTATLTTFKCGKSNQFSKVVEISTILSTDGTEKSAFVTLFPNPTSGNFEITFTTNFQKAQIEIYAMNGTKLLNKNSSNVSSYKIDSSKWSCGIYLLKLTTDEKVFISKIIKN